MASRSRQPSAAAGARSFREIVGTIRALIRSGTWPARHRLPPRTELVTQLRSTPVTIQRAVDTLVEDGYLETIPRLGTFVAAHLPHQSHFALTFPWSAPHFPSQFFYALRQEALRRQRPDRRISLFQGIERHVDEPDYQRLLGFIEAQRLAGLIFAGSPHYLTGSPVLQAPGLPRVAVMAPRGQLEFSTVYPAVDDFLPRAFARLRTHGRRPVSAMVLLNAMAAANVAGVQAVAQAEGVRLPAWCVQAAHPESPDWATQIVAALFRKDAPNRPNALVVTDDNLVTQATAGLLIAGVRVPQDAQVIVQTNFPYPTPSRVPVVRLGYDVRALMDVCLARLDQQRRGERTLPHTAIPPVFEDELALQPTAQPEEVVT